MAVEFVVAVPAFIALLLLVGAGGEWVTANGQVGAAARDAARQASLEINFAAVQPAVHQVVQADLKNLCPGAQVPPAQLLINGGKVADTAWANGAQAVQITVSCNVNLKAFSIIGIPASKTITETAAAPLDPFTQRTGN